MIYIVRPVLAESRIYNHSCSSLEVANKVKEYIDRRGEPLEIIHKEDHLFFDCPGMKLVHDFGFIKIGVIETRVDDLGMLIYTLKKKQEKDDRGFVRISSFGCNLCISPEEHKECLDYIEYNKNLLKSKEEEVESIIDSILRDRKCQTNP
jgi:hypothetical protein